MAFYFAQFLTGLASAASLYVLAPRASDAAALLTAQDDPEALSDHKLREAQFDRAKVAAGIDEALAAKDADLAQSYVSLAIDHGVFIDVDLAKRQLCVRRSDWNARLERRRVDGSATCRSRDGSPRRSPSIGT